MKTTQDIKDIFTDFMESLEPELQSLGYSYKRPKKLAVAIKSLSDHFIDKHDSTTPWEQESSQAAYLAYYTPLNFWRVLHLFRDINSQIQWNDIDTILDFGVGSGAASFALDHFLLDKSAKTDLIAIDHSNKALEVFKGLSKWSLKNLKIKSLDNNINSLRSRLDFNLASYSLNELESLPSRFFQSQYVLIIEPSSSNESRKLMELKDQLSLKNYQILAPCTHQKPCPMLENKKLWCHARTPALPQSYLSKIEEHLAFKNRTLTYSYLFAKKKESQSLESEVHYRVVSDPLKEKGKTRWNLCSTQGIETLSLLQRTKIDLELQRGDLLSLKRTDLEQKKTELRINDLNSVSKIGNKTK